jgi:trimethylamine--corrinoid protein Co-methyltransferase
MKPLYQFLRVLSDEELDKLHDSALRLLENPGMKVENEDALKTLKAKGASVDFKKEVVHFPQELVEETIEIARREERERFSKGHTTVDAPNALTMSWHTPFHERTPEVKVSLGGGCPQYYDHEKKETRIARGNDFLSLVHLAEGIPEIVSVGNAVHYLKESDGTMVAPKMVAIKGAATVAKHSSKPGCTAIIDCRQLDYLMEIGIIVKSSAEEYIKRPIFVNIHDTEAPLRITRPEAAIMVEMARRKLSIFILPMPLTGIAGPIYPIANSIIGAAEILGVWTMTKVIRDDTPVEAAVISGALNPKTGAACFSGPETILQDLAIAQLFREKYGTRCSTGPGIIDAPVPGPLSIYERTLKSLCASLAGEPLFNAGILGAGVVFSPEQLLIDIDIAYAQNAFCQGIGGNHFEDSLDLIREKGIGGLFIDTDHTAKHFRECLWIPKIFERLKSTDVQNALKHDPVEMAYNRWREIIDETELYSIDEDRQREIDRVVEKASKALSSIDGATD